MRLPRSLQEFAKISDHNISGQSLLIICRSFDLVEKRCYKTNDLLLKTNKMAFLTYKKAGVDIDEADKFVKKIKPLFIKTERREVLGKIGGGFYENIPRVLPDGLAVRIRKGSWPIPRIFRKIQERGKIREKEMFRTFNMGVGMVLIVGSRNAQRTISLFENMGQKAWIIGELIEGKREVVFVRRKSPVPI